MKKFFAGLLASIMLMSVLFVPAFAASANTDTPSLSLLPYNQAERIMRSKILQRKTLSHFESNRINSNLKELQRHISM